MNTRLREEWMMKIAIGKLTLGWGWRFRITYIHNPTIVMTNHI